MNPQGEIGTLTIQSQQEHPMTNPTYGWVIQPAVRGAVGTETLMNDKHRIIERVRGYFTTIWVEDNFHWDDRPLVEGWSALSMLATKYTDLTFGVPVLTLV